MRTDELIDALAADGARRSPPAWAYALPAIGASLATVALFAGWLSVRPDIAEALGTPRFLFKLVVLIVLGATTLGASRRVLRPGSSAGYWGIALLAAPLLLIAAVLAELAFTPTAEWARLAIGSNAIRCLTLVPLLSALPLAGLVLSFRSGAPERPVAAGALAGLLAAAIGSVLYAAMCADDSPLFVALWYPIAIGAVAAIGALVGRLALRW